MRRCILKGNNVTIVKSGKIVNITEDDLCKGDVLLLQAGDLVPADLKLVETAGLEVDEFDLTGEIMPVEKKVNEEGTFVYKGSRVIRGYGKGVVVATGEETEYGEILKQRWGQVKNKFPPLIRKKYFILLIFLLPPFIVSLSLYRNLALPCVTTLIAILAVLLQNDELFKYVLISSEVKGLKHQNIQIRDETSLGIISDLDIICFDKTGVLTTRNIEVKSVHFADEIPDMDSFKSDKNIFYLTKIACALCNDVVFIEKVDKADPIDRALISFALKNGVDLNKIASKYKRIYEKPFNSEDRYMACGFELDEKRIFFAKGDPEIILQMCKNYVTVSNAVKKSDLNFLSSINAKTNSFNQKGNRTIALAYSYSDLGTPPSHYTFLCLLQLENAVKPGIPEVAKSLKDDGVRILILTGDRPETAVKIGEEIGIENNVNYLSGKNMAQMKYSDIAKQSEYVSVFPRLLPSQKGILIMLLQQRKKIVAMVGDGVNDVMALRVADVGISFVENSSPLARRASKILINDLADLLTIVRSAKRAKQRIKATKFLRAIILISIFLFSYAWIMK